MGQTPKPCVALDRRPRRQQPSNFHPDLLVASCGAPTTHLHGVVALPGQLPRQQLEQDHAVTEDVTAVGGLLILQKQFRSEPRGVAGTVFLAGAAENFAAGRGGERWGRQA